MEKVFTGKREKLEIPHLPYYAKRFFYVKRPCLTNFVTIV